jgi:hypothetical protein
MDITAYKMTVEQFGDDEYFTECAQDIVNNGADGGWRGFTYYNDTVPFGEKIRDYLKPGLIELAEDMVEASIFSMLDDWKCLQAYTPDEIAEGWYSNENGELHTAVMNALAWYALEEAARQFVETKEEQ